MTKRLLLVLVSLVLVAFAAGLSTGVEARKAPPTKVGFVDLQRSLLETTVGKKARAGLEREKAKRQEEIDSAQKALQEEVQALEKKRAVMKPDILAKRERALQEKLVELQQGFMKAQQDLNRREQELTKKIFVKASSIIDDIAKRDGYTMILEKSEGGLLYSADAYDITSEVNKRLDADKS